MKKSIILLVGGLISACAGGYNPAYYFNEIQVVNLTGATIRDVSLDLQNSPKSLNCAEVLQFAMCADLFGKLRYPQQGIELSWTGADGSRRSNSSNPAVPAFYPAAFPLRIVLEIGEQGSVRVFYEQEEPDGGGIYISGLL